MPSEKFTPFNAQEIPNLSGYVAVVTGGTQFPYLTLLPFAITKGAHF